MVADGKLQEQLDVVCLSLVDLFHLFLFHFLMEADLSWEVGLSLLVDLSLDVDLSLEVDLLLV